MRHREGWHYAPVRTMMCARSHTAVPPIGIADLFFGDRPRGAPAPRLGPREVRPKPHSKGSYSELCGQQHNSEYDPFPNMAR